jgi:RHS repeat-associated protein
VKDINNNLWAQATDHLGSPTISVNQQTVEVRRFTPFGAPRNSTPSLSDNNPSDFGFTGQRNDIGTGLTYYKARYYDPLLGQFTQPDPFTVDGFNRYSYVRNSPLRFTDPTGYWSIGDAFEGIGDWLNNGPDPSVADQSMTGFDCPGCTGEWTTVDAVFFTIFIGLLVGIASSAAIAAVPALAVLDTGLDVHDCAMGSRLSCGAIVAPYVSGRLLRLHRYLRRGSNAVDAPSASPWDLGWSSRGLAIEDALGGNLPRSFPTIDRFANGTATSIKSIDLTASSYQSTSALTSRLSGYVDKVAGFNGATFSGTRITSGQITGRELVISCSAGRGDLGATGCVE